jgi:Kef-type K+ transport system membrane component KefB
MGGALAVTALPVLSRIIRERGLAESRVASPALFAAAVCDAFAWLLLVVVAGNVTLGGDTAVLALGTLLIAVLTAALCCRLQPGWVATAVAIAGAAAAAFTSDLLSLHPGVGALAFGLVISKCPRIGDVIEAPERFALVLLPVWFCVPALSIDPGLLTTSANWTMFGVVARAAVAGKVVGGALGASIAGFDLRQAIAIGVLLNARGLTELVFVTVALERGLLPMDVYVVLITVALVLTAATAPLLGLLRVGAPERAHRRSPAGPAR